MGESQDNRHIVLLALAGMLFLTAITAFSNSSQLVLEPMVGRRGFTGAEGYMALTLQHITMTLAQFFATPIVRRMGAKYSLLIFGSSMLLYLASYIDPTVVGIYSTSLVFGFGNGVWGWKYLFSGRI